MIDVAAARALAAKKLSGKLTEWSLTQPESPAWKLSLKPPTESQALGDQRAAETWAREWVEAGRSASTDVIWESRSWRALGQQSVPIRIELDTAESMADFAGGQSARDWRTLSQRVATLRGAFGRSEPLDRAIRRHSTEILRWEERRFEQVVAAVEWLTEHSVEGMRPRQLPIRGVDSKWFASHRSLLTALHAAVTQRAELGIVDSDRLIRVRFLDASLAPGGLGDVAAPPEGLAGLTIRPRSVLVLENLESLLALPGWPGLVAIHGNGYAVDVVGDLPWLRGIPVFYWGDLDSHGFAILHRLRAHLPHVVSVLMDANTLETHRDLWVQDPKPTRAGLPSLTPSEADALHRLRLEGDVRLEQERIPWSSALRALRQALE